MHIPDGYLSPSTCATMYVVSAPFWHFALKRVKQTLNARLAPMLSSCAAFSFVIMMFNLPLPGGTTGHAVGIGVATILLGPSASILAISGALLVQAVFFGDGGITAFGANCFNMAIVGSLVSHGVYRLIAGPTDSNSPRLVVAAGFSGYIAINAAAFCAAIEFGLQPLFFHDASGAPLYAPYSLSVAIPAMMIGHLTFAGFAEGILTAGVIGWLQHSDPALLKRAMPTSSVQANLLRPLWIGLAGLMIATPLGLLAAGSAWGEWGKEDFQNPEARLQIAAASHNVAPPEAVPSGLEKLSTIWSSPLPDYAPSFLKNPQLGYLLSSMFGVGLILAGTFGFSRFARLLKRRENLSS